MCEQKETGRKPVVRFTTRKSVVRHRPPLPPLPISRRFPKAESRLAKKLRRRSVCHSPDDWNWECGGLSADVGDRISFTLRPVVSNRLANWQKRQASMQDVCSACHASGWLENFYKQYEGTGHPAESVPLREFGTHHGAPGIA